MAYNTGLWGEDREGVGAFYFGTPYFDVSATVNKKLTFIESNLNFSAVESSSGLGATWTKDRWFTFGDGGSYWAQTGTSAQHSYALPGTYSNNGVIVYVKNAEGITMIADQDFSLQINVNPLPLISFIGTPNVSSTITFQDDSGSLYIANTIVSADWNFGDGYTSSTTNLTASFEHTYSAIGNYTVSISAYDISGNIGVDSISFAILENTPCKAKENYITLCGPDLLGRFGSCKNINLVEYLPQYLRGGEAEDFLILFEDFLNNMYDGTCGWLTSSTELPVSQSWSVPNSGTISAVVNQDFSFIVCGDNADTDATNAELIELTEPSSMSLPTSAQKISILEKINRLTELHDPSLIDLEYIQFFANNLGYSVNVGRDEIGVRGTAGNFGLTEFGGMCSAADVNRYLRFVVENLPTWYKIKTTRNAIKVMLYSFGLVGEIIEYFTDSYKEISAGGKWRADYEGNLQYIDNNWFPTPHFAVFVDHEMSSDISFEIERRN
ncbi:MAG: PKD domain-containing protein, partial [Flavobacterium piscis]|nr:PKD domain-containing protein [Flavobacterium piscis]